ncbi:MAG TPA: tRNA(His) guanylyltransferase Thg1 family protein [Ktedonobacterales bacterium]|nr:tRNA(His) guanylyltransferase Thg1 family protein [Ktedonobacterales bacterium]
MNPDDFEKRLRALEYFHTLRLIPGAWTVVRVDGRGFSRFTEAHFEKPFDPTFHTLMIQTAKALLEELQGIYAYTESDEISVLFRPDWKLFDREVEKIVSISAGIASAAFTQGCQTPAHFDSRIWLGVDPAQVVDYFRWRQDDATRCALNGWCYWMLRKMGKSVAEATSTLKSQSTAFKNELLFQQGINFNDLSAWQRRGVGLSWEIYEKAGYDPIQSKAVTARRRRVKIDEALPVKEEYGLYIQRLLDANQPTKDQ